ncbi:MAG: hypothetical protein C4541_00005 [Candidatus Auribacter fodinae]|jgi:hypothetical protein|uniref:Uncharacterized protein n=1 Tax=Candidatus Auribacter fodinae TaxID=2093366 RepID=A0A3A4RGW7_9BACT|nr:MAG: hypothetical protein C4541_00005 [Candidatus Auribacter fodinae]
MKRSLFSVLAIGLVLSLTIFAVKSYSCDTCGCSAQEPEKHEMEIHDKELGIQSEEEMNMEEEMVPAIIEETTGDEGTESQTEE